MMTNWYITKRHTKRGEDQGTFTMTTIIKGCSLQCPEIKTIQTVELRISIFAEMF